MPQKLQRRRKGTRAPRIRVPNNERALFTVDNHKFVGVIQRLSLTGGSAVLSKRPIPQGTLAEMRLNTVFGKVTAQIEFLHTAADGIPLAQAFRFLQMDDVSCERFSAAAEQMEQLTAEPAVTETISDKPLSEVVTDKGYHSNEKLVDLKELGIRTYISEPKRGRRNWTGKAAERDAVYANRRRIRGERGKKLLRQRGLMLERPFAHCYETGGMRRLHLRGRKNILKRLLVHIAGFNLILVLRLIISKGTLRGLQDLAAAYFLLVIALINAIRKHFQLVLAIE